MKSGVLLAILVLCSVAVVAEVPSVQHAEVPLDLVGGRDTLDTVNLLVTSRGLQVGALGQSGVFVTEPLDVPLADVAPFLAGTAVWTVENAGLEAVTVEIRSSPDGTVWSDWESIRPDSDAWTGTLETFGGLVYLPKETKLLQFRVAMPYQDALPATLTAFRAVFISPGESPDPSPEPSASPITTLAVSKPSVVSRTGWGCPDGQSSPQWTPQTTTVSHLIVHHTDNSNTSSDWPAVVRSIHTFHKVTNGWGDIGYNYLVDPNGVIYEGRAGGDNIIGAHFSCANSGTMGVAFLGRFTSVQPTSSAWSSVTRMLAWKADQRGIDPHGVAFHSGTQFNLNRISGHRDANGSPTACDSGTVCPGNTLYAMFGDLRDDVADLIDPPNAPGNDSCGNATTLTSNTSCNYTSGTVLNATASGVARPSCDTGSANLFDVWYRFTASASSHTITVDPDGGDGDPVFAVYGSCGSSLLACKDDGSEGDTETMTVNGLSAGSTYYVRVYDWGSEEPSGSDADFRICVTHTAVPNYTISLSASPQAGGTVSGAGTFASGSQRTVTASPNSGYVFNNWTEGGNSVSSNTSYQFTLNGNRTLVANFTQQPGDTTPPLGSIVVNSGAQYTGTTNVSLTLNATDAVGVTGHYTSSSSSTPSSGSGGWVSVGSTTSFNTTAGFTLPAGDGSKTVYAWFKDAAGNVSSRYSDSITLDQTAPSNGSLNATAGILQVTLNWSGQSDATSGVAGTKLVFAVGSIAPSDCSGSALATASPYTHTGLIPVQPYSYRVCATDGAGNTSSGATATATPQQGGGNAHIRNDVNGDERADIFWRNTSTGATSIWFMNGTGYSSTGSGPTVPAGWAPAVAGDFDGDGQTEFFWRNASTGQTSVWLGWNGSAFATLATGLTIPIEWVPVAAGDINGDGNADLFWHNSTTGETSIWFMNGATYSVAIRSTTVPTSWYPALTGDFDGDERTDILWRSLSTGETSLWMGWNGSAFSVQTRSVTAGTVWVPVGAGDVSGDGRSDILWRNTSTGQTSLWVMNGAATPAFVTLTTVPTTWGAAAFGDYDGDDHTDVFWRHPTTGETSIWIGYNGTTFTTQIRGTTVPAAWVPFHSR